MIYGQMPPEPDQVAPRNTDQWRDAVHAKKQWIAMNLARGASLDELVAAGAMDKYGEEGSPRAGRLSHDYEYWQNAQQGKETGDEGLPGELGAAEWDVGNFNRQVNVGDWTEWPPGSGQYFNDPVNDSSKREWVNQFGDRVAPPADGGPEIDYNDPSMHQFRTLKEYLADRESHAAAARKAKPYNPQMGQPGQPNADVTTGPPTAVKMPPGQMPALPTTQTQRPGGPTAAPGAVPGAVSTSAEGPWGANASRPMQRPGGFGSRPVATAPTQQVTPGGFGSNQPALQKRRGAFGGAGGMY